jgi:hypothetical protein
MSNLIKRKIKKEIFFIIKKNYFYKSEKLNLKLNGMNFEYENKIYSLSKN